MSSIIATTSPRVVLADGDRYSAGFTAGALLVAALMVQTLALHCHWTWQWLNHSISGFLSRMSYAAHLHHGFARSVIPRAEWLPQPSSILLAMLGAVAFGVVSFWTVKGPFAALKGWRA